jgi:hypothetical protein
VCGPFVVVVEPRQLRLQALAPRPRDNSWWCHESATPRDCAPQAHVDRPGAAIRPTPIAPAPYQFQQLWLTAAPFWSHGTELSSQCLEPLPHRSLPPMKASCELAHGTTGIRSQAHSKRDHDGPMQCAHEHSAPIDEQGQSRDGAGIAGSGAQSHDG